MMGHAVSTSPLQYWAALVREDRTLPWFEAALAIAQDAYPALDFVGTIAQIDALAAKLGSRFAPDAPLLHRLRMLNRYFFDELHFRGNVNDYDDADNSYLNRVLERRCGIPISLAAIYMEIGQQAGIPLQGVAFPGRFLVKLKLADGTLFIDVFAGGRSLSRADLEDRIEPYAKAHALAAADLLPRFLGAASPREILARMLRNLKALYARETDAQRLLAVLDRIVVLLPGDADERRDRGDCYAALGCPRAAIADLQAYLQARPDALDGASVVQRITRLRAQVDRLG